ncbi:MULTISPECIES: RICIN domain-containing protein [Paraburkholderia]|uniref:RICIN domain-containing protein n=1 Tax=Paraburkholderia TaxID=1822464 RepID=UPI0028A59467|nr:RICIN domain-containing protein [Paraburkholderia podalyriae]
MLSGPAAAQSNAAVSTLRPSGTTLCTDVTGISQSDGAAVIVWTCNGQANQSWQLQPVGTAYQLIAQHSGKCLDITGISFDAGAPAIQWACNGQPNQQFTLRQQGTGYAIVAAHSSKCLVAQGGGIRRQASKSCRCHATAARARPGKSMACTPRLRRPSPCRQAGRRRKHFRSCRSRQPTCPTARY